MGSTPDQEEQKLVFTVLQYNETDYRTGSMEEIAEQIRQPAYVLSRLLKKHTGQNFRELLQARKLQQAVYLLENTTLTVDSILARIGYENSSYFHRLFRQRYGCSPKEYRNRG